MLKRYADRWTEEKENSYFSRIQMAVEELNYLIDNILLIGRAELGKLSFDPQVTDLNDFCINLIKYFENNKNDYILKYQNLGNSLLVSLDKNLLHIALSNLILNAFKYSQLNSKVEILLSCNKKTILLQVKDQGIGIPKQDQPHLFEPFYRGSNTREIQGNGLGLAVVKRIIEIHGGTISVASDLNVGTTFTLTFPIHDI